MVFPQVKETATKPTLTMLPEYKYGGTTHEKLISCEFNIDTACVELKYDDNSMISIDCIAVENELDAFMLQRSELDWLIYNKPLEYADLVLKGGTEEYIKGTSEHRLID